MKKLKKKIELIKNKHLCLLFVALFFSFHSFAQSIFYQDVFYGGVTGGGFSTGLGSGSGTLPLFIESGSTIKKAYLFSYRIGYPPNVPIIINSVPYLFDTANICMKVNHASPFASPIHLYYNDITDSLNSSITSIFNITIPSQFGLPINWGYWTTFIYIAYENPLLPKIASTIIINDKNFIGNEFYNTTNLNPINTNFPTGFAIYTDRMDEIDEGANVFFNSNNIGFIGGSDAVNNLWGGAGVKGHFYYQNNTLFGLDDDTPDSLMSGTDGLADISSYLNNNDTQFNFQLTHQFYPSMNPAAVNVNLAYFLTYSTPCDTFTTTATTNIDTVCAGENIQLTATGGVSYSWFSAFSTFNDSTLANPLATPSQTTTYIVTIKNDSGCVKTEHVKVWVNPAPKPDTIVATPQRCGSTDGSLTVGNITNGTPPYTYQLTTLANGNLQSQISNSFNNLLAGNYLINITDSNGCQWQSDTLFLPEINDITVNFSVYTLPWVWPQPNPLGTAPLTVYTQNSSVNVNSYEWWVNEQFADTIALPIAIGTTLNTQHTFEDGGTFEICLLAYNNIPTCGDTVCNTISIAPNPGIDSLVLVIPNVFSPNHDGNNDNFVLQVQGADLLESVEVEIFNRWGMLVQGLRFDVQGLNGQIASSLAMTELVIWDGTTTSGTKVPEGTYFYVVTYTKLSGESESLKGSVTLLR